MTQHLAPHPMTAEVKTPEMVERVAKDMGSFRRRRRKPTGVKYGERF